MSLAVVFGSVGSAQGYEARSGEDSSSSPLKPEIVLNSLVSQDFYEDIKDAWNKIPKVVQVLLGHNHARAIVGTMQSEIFPEMLGEKMDSHDPSDTRRVWNQLAAQYDPDRRVVAIAERYLLDRCAAPDLHSPNRPEEMDCWAYHQNVAATTLHEAGHALSYSLRDLFGRLFSASPRFKEAYRQDIDKMGGYAAAVRLGYGYFADPGKDPERAREETSAELFAILWGSSQHRDMLKRFPGCYAVTRDFMDALTLLYAGRAKLSDFAAYVAAFVGVVRRGDRMTAISLPEKEERAVELFWNEVAGGGVAGLAELPQPVRVQEAREPVRPGVFVRGPLKTLSIP